MENKIKLTNAERQKKYREKRKLDKKRDDEYKKKQNERNVKRRRISEMSENQKRHQRELWKKQNERRRNKNKLKDLNNNTAIINIEDYNSSFITTEEISLNNPIRNRSVAKPKYVYHVETKIERQLRKLKKNNSLLKKENESLKHKIEKVQLEKRRAQKKSSRIADKLKDILQNKPEKTFKAACTKGKEILKRLKEKHKAIRIENNKKNYVGNVMKRLRMLRLGQSMRLILQKKKQYNENYCFNLTKEFYCRDENSRTTSGKKETITKNKSKQQKRFLTDSLQNLFKKFCLEYPSVNISYRSFARYRPFWVKNPSFADRNTCACQEHANINFKIQKLFHMKAIEERESSKLLDHIMCQNNSANCAWGICKDCKKNKVPTTIIDKDAQTSWYKWEIVSEEKENKKVGRGNYVAKVIKKVEKLTSLGTLEKEFQCDFQNFKKHSYNVKTQYRAYKFCKDNLKQNEALIHIDFSENYACKLSEEVQMFHFGASRNQVSLHTGVMYLKNECTQKDEVISFTTVSSNLEHGPAAIWAHLTPILKYLKSIAPEVATVHFFSDGPSSQYRQKNNFYLLSNKFFNFEFKCATWNFFEKSHGKGAADGVGAVLKRTADQLVAHGSDIMDAKSFYNAVKEKVKNVKLFYVSSDNILQANKSLPIGLKTINGTRNIHQIVVKEKGEIMYRNLSCFCLLNDWFKGSLCSCHKMKENFFKFPTKKRRIHFSEVYSDSEEEL